MEILDFSVEGMSCTGCEETVSNAVKNVDGIYRVEADHETGTVEVTVESGDKQEIRQAIHSAGFEVSA